MSEKTNMEKVDRVCDVCGCALDDGLSCHVEELLEKGYYHEYCVGCSRLMGSVYARMNKIPGFHLELERLIKFLDKW